MALGLAPLFGCVSKEKLFSLSVDKSNLTYVCRISRIDLSSAEQNNPVSRIKEDRGEKVAASTESSDVIWDVGDDIKKRCSRLRMHL